MWGGGGGVQITLTGPKRLWPALSRIKTSQNTEKRFTEYNRDNWTNRYTNVDHEVFFVTFDVPVRLGSGYAELPADG